MLEQVGMCINGDFIVNDVQLILVWSQLVTCSLTWKIYLSLSAYFFSYFIPHYFLWQLIKFRFFISSLMKELIILYYYYFVGIFSVALLRIRRFSFYSLFILLIVVILLLPFLQHTWWLHLSSVVEACLSIYVYWRRKRRNKKEFKWIEWGHGHSLM